MITVKKIPNILTTIRILLLPIVVIFLFLKINIVVFSFEINNFNFVMNLNIFISGLLFIFLSFTDFLDGYIARKYNIISDWGKIWDPIADKILINSIFICLSILKVVPFYFTLLIIIRDTIVDSYRIIAVKNNIEVAANKAGKLKTILQIICITWILLIFFPGEQLENFNSHWQYYLLTNFWTYPTILISIWSGAGYIKSYKKK